MSNPEMLRLAIDFENPAPEWWANGGSDLWDALRESFDGNDVVVDEGAPAPPSSRREWGRVPPVIREPCRVQTVLHAGCGAEVVPRLP